jgi:hypothetical protein
MKRTGTIEKNITNRGIINPLPRLLALQAAADYLGLTTWGMREAIWRGDIPVVRFRGGRKMFVDTADMEKFITMNKRTF